MRYGLVFVAIFLAVTAFGCGATDGAKDGAEACAQVTCPAGTAPFYVADAATACSAGVSSQQGIISAGASASAGCMGEGSCTLICEPVSECCGGESWTDGSYTCETPCLGACSCTDKCGKVTGVGCEADCGLDLCGADEVCEGNACVVECEGGAEACGNICCGAGESCHLNACCPYVANCEGKACGGDGCGGLCEDQPSIEPCGTGETCEDGECVLDCSGIVDTCDPTGETQVIRTCKDGKLMDGDDCAVTGADTGEVFCANHTDGAVCGKCSSDDDCEGDATCLVTPGVTTGCIYCVTDDHCEIGQTCDAGQCVGEPCDPNDVCNPTDGPKRVCGPDGCDGFCEDLPGNGGCGLGVCGEDGQCEEKALCLVQGRPDDPPFPIPYGLPFCNGALSNWDTQTPPYNATYNTEAVLSCHWAGPTAEKPTQNECVCEPHEFADAPDGEGPTKNCGSEGKLCEGLLDEWQALNAASWDDFACLTPTTCLEQTGLPEQTRYCNPPVGDAGHVDKYPAGWLIGCYNKAGLVDYYCDECWEEGTNNELVSPCDDEGVKCYPKDWEGDDGVVDNAACETSREGWCVESGAGTEGWSPGCCREEDEECDGVTAWQGAPNGEGPGGGETNEGDDGCDSDGCPPYVFPTLRKVCKYDSVHNVIFTEEESCANQGMICVEGWLDDDMSQVGTCQVQSDPCPNGENWDAWCNAGDDFNADYPEGHQIQCEFFPEANKVVLKPHDCQESDSGEPQPECPEDDPHCCHGEGWVCAADWQGQGVCEPDLSKCCDDVESFCHQEEGASSPGPSVCNYDAVTNDFYFTAPPCENDTLCISSKFYDPSYGWSEGDDNFYTVPATCEVPVVCPKNANGDSSDRCNVEGEVGYHAEWGHSIINCFEEGQTNQLGWSQAEACDDTSGQECFPGGVAACYPCKPGFAEGVQLWADGAEQWHGPKCAVPQVCPQKAWCNGSGTLEGEECTHNAETNFLHLTKTECGPQEQCVIVNMVTEEDLVDWNPSQEESWYRAYVEPEGDASVWSDNSYWKGACLTTACGPSVQGNQPTCNDLGTMTCYEPDYDVDNGWSDAWDGIYASKMSNTDSQWQPTYACLPELPDMMDVTGEAPLHPEFIHVRAKQSEFYGGSDCWSDGSKIFPCAPSESAELVAFCNQKAGGGYWFDDPTESSAEPFVMWAWLDTVTSQDGPWELTFEEMTTGYDEEHFFTGWESPSNCSSCATGSSEQQELQIRCCLFEHGIRINLGDVDDSEWIYQCPDLPYEWWDWMN